MICLRDCMDLKSDENFKSYIQMSTYYFFYISSNVYLFYLDSFLGGGTLNKLILFFFFFFYLFLPLQHFLHLVFICDYITVFDELW